MIKLTEINSIRIRPTPHIMVLIAYRRTAKVKTSLRRLAGVFAARKYKVW